MNSILLQTATGPIVLFQFLLSLFFVLRGHNLPGGGFIGGLLIASGISLYAIAFDVQKAQRVLRFKPVSLIGFGLLLSASSGLFASFFSLPFMKAHWGPELYIPLVGKIALGTPFLFDIGVYFVVLGMTVSVIFSLYQTEGGSKWK